MPLFSVENLSLRFPIACVFLLGLGLQGCARSPERAISPGKTTEAQLTASLGLPAVRAPSLSRPRAEVRSYRECSYQVENGVVVASFCSPTDEERSLQYWRQLWRGEETTWGAVNAKRGPHGATEFVLAAPGLRKSVIYNRESDQVVQVVEHSRSGGANP